MRLSLRTARLCIHMCMCMISSQSFISSSETFSKHRKITCMNFNHTHWTVEINEFEYTAKRDSATQLHLHCQWLNESTHSFIEGKFDAKGSLCRRKIGDWPDFVTMLYFTRKFEWSRLKSWLEILLFQSEIFLAWNWVKCLHLNKILCLDYVFSD